MDNIVIAIQASMISWEGGKDLCANVWEGQLVVEHTIERVNKSFGQQIDVYLLVPDIPENRLLSAVAEKHGLGIVFGSFHDVIDRFCALPERYRFAVRLAGMHSFVSVSLVRDLISVAQTNPTVDLVLPPDTLDIQFTAQLISLTRLRALQRVNLGSHMRIDPAGFMRVLSENVTTLTGEMYARAEDRAKLRELATHIYQDDVLDTGYEEEKEDDLSRNSQIFGHYKLAFGYCISHSESTITRILDMGGGFGFRPLLQKMSPVALEYYLLDIDTRKVDMACRRSPETIAVYGDCRATEFPDNYFDLVLGFEVLEHVASPERVISEALRVVKEEGFVALSTPQNRSGMMPLNPNHLHEFTIEEFGELCGQFSKGPSFFTFESGRNVTQGLVVGNSMMAILSKEARNK